MSLLSWGWRQQFPSKLFNIYYYSLDGFCYYLLYTCFCFLFVTCVFFFCPWDVSDSLRVGSSGDRIPVGVKLSAPPQTGPGAHPSLLYYGYQVSFSVGKRSGRGVDYPPQLAPRIKKEYSYTLNPLWAFVVCFRLKSIFPTMCTACTWPYRCRASTLIKRYYYYYYHRYYYYYYS